MKMASSSKLQSAKTVKDYLQNDFGPVQDYTTVHFMTVRERMDHLATYVGTIGPELIGELKTKGYHSLAGKLQGFKTQYDELSKEYTRSGEILSVVGGSEGLLCEFSEWVGGKIKHDTELEVELKAVK